MEQRLLKERGRKKSFCRSMTDLLYTHIDFIDNVCYD